MSLNRIQDNNKYGGGQYGVVYTKPEVVKFILDEVGYLSSSNLSSVTIMEPSCGEGEFLLEIVGRLKNSSQLFNFDFNQAYHNCIFASEIDAEKVKVCCERLKIEFPELINVEENIIVEDYLLGRHNQVDIVVGNPPYIRYEEIPEQKLAIYKSFPTFYYRADIYVLFYEKSLSLLKPNGKHCFVCSNRWMRNKYGKLLRQLVAENYSIDKIINMENVDAFQKNVLAYPAITLISNKNRNDSVLYANINKIDDFLDVEYEMLPSPEGEDWSSMFNSFDKGLSLIEKQGFKIGIGVATGADKIFISTALKDKVEEDLLLPVIGARDLSGDCMKWGGKYFLNPYSKDGKLIALDKYPKAKEYLESHKEQLISRHKVRKNPSRWYATIDSVSPTLMTKTKILLPDISGNNYVFVDEGNFYPQHNIYYIIGGNLSQLRVLAAILMSDFVRKQLKNLTNHMNGGYARWQSQYLRKLRIPVISAISDNLSDKILKYYENKDIEGINNCVDEILSNECDNKDKRVKKQPKQLVFSFC